MITLSCERCGKPVPSTAGRWGGAAICPHCQHVNVVPPEPEVVGPGSGGTKARRSSTTTWVLLGLLLTAAAGAWIWSRAGAPATDDPASSTAASPSEALQEKLLRRNIDRPGDPMLGQRFQAINARHFRAALPAIPVVWEPELANVGSLARDEFRLEGMFGLVGSRSMILLNPRLRNDPKAIDRALSHEMVHAYLHSTGDSATTHGPTFQAVLSRIATEGAFESLVSTPEERSKLRAWLDGETVRLEAERRALEELGQQIDRERGEIERAMSDISNADERASLEARRDAYNLLASQANDRVNAQRAAHDELNRQIARYNLMITYPDGLGDSTPMPTAPTPAPMGNPAATMPLGP